MKTFSIFEELNNMITQGFARITDPETSKEAAKSVDVSNMEQVVLDVIKSFPEGCISQEVESILSHVRASSITPRYRPLIHKGLIVDTGQKRPGFSGRNQRVMKAV